MYAVIYAVARAPGAITVYGVIYAAARAGGAKTEITETEKPKLRHFSENVSNLGPGGGRKTEQLRSPLFF